MPRLLLPILLLAATAAAQVDIEGDLVLKTTGQPLPGIRVTLTWRDTTRLAVTDAAGHFAFPTVARGSTLNFDGPGVLPRRQLIAIGPKDTQIALHLPMTPAAAISGRVLDQNGWPIPSALVLVAPSRTATRATAYTRAGDLGEFRIPKLPPGRYYLRVRPAESIPWSDYLPVWYPTPIDLTEGQEANADFHLEPGGGVQLSGRVVLPDDFIASNMALKYSYTDVGFGTGGIPVPLAPDRSFVIRHLPPGRYILAVTPVIFANDAAPQYSAVRFVDVAGGNIDNFVLNVAPTPARALKIAPEINGGFHPEALHVTLQPGVGQPIAARADASGAITVPGIWPGRYLVNANYYPGGQVTAVQFAGRELPLPPYLEFDGTDAPLRIAIDARPPVQLTGTVTTAAGQPAIGAAIVFLRAGADYVPSPPAIPGPFYTDQTGAFTAYRVTPGPYRVYIVEDPTEVDFFMANPAFRQTQEKALPPVTLNPGENPPLKLTLPSPNPRQ